MSMFHIHWIGWISNRAYLLQYFPFSVDLFRDDKIKRIFYLISKFEVRGLYIFLKWNCKLKSVKDLHCKLFHRNKRPNIQPNERPITYNSS